MSWETLLVDAGPKPAPGYVVLARDTDLAATARTAGRDLQVAVLISGGAGGLLPLATRRVPGIEVVRAHSTLRDLDALAGNAARVVAAASGIEVEVAVELPYASGWEAAAEVVEAAGLTAGVRPHDRLAEQLSFLVELDLGYHLLPGPAGPATDPVAALAATAVLIEDGDVEAARAILAGGSTDDVPEVELGRLHRRVRSVAVSDVGAAADRLSRSRWG